MKHVSKILPENSETKEIVTQLALSNVQVVPEEAQVNAKVPLITSVIITKIMNAHQEVQYVKLELPNIHALMELALLISMELSILWVIVQLLVPQVDVPVVGQTLTVHAKPLTLYVTN